MSCGCLSQSHGEFLIEQLLKENNISYIYDEDYFQDLILPSGSIGRYDFILLDENKQPYRLIEYDGKQHYVPIDFFGGQEAFDRLKKNDEVKNQYAKQHSLPLVRIPYTTDNITLDILLNDKYLI